MCPQNVGARVAPGEDKYSIITRDRWTPETADTATFPRLTTQNSANNYRSSDYWIYKTDRIDLAKIQLSYELPQNLTAAEKC